MDGAGNHDAENTAPPSPPPAVEKRVPLWLLVLLCAMAPLSMDALLPSIPALSVEMGVDPSVGQYVVTFFLVGFAGGQLLWGPLADRIGRRPVILAGLSLYALTCVAILAYPHLWVVLAMRAAAGLSACAGMVTAKALVLDAIPHEGQAKAMSGITAAVFLAPSLGPVAGGLLQTATGWWGIFAALLALSAFLAIYTALRLPETLARPDPDALRPRRIFGNWWALLGQLRFRNPALVVCLMSAGMFAFITGSPEVLMRGMGLNATAFGFVYMVITVGYIGGALGGVRLARPFGARRVVHAATVLGMLGGVAILALVWLPELPATLRMAWFIGGAFLFYLALGLTQPISMTVGLQGFAEMSGSAAALQGFLQVTAGAIASSLLGLFGDHMLLGTGLFLTASGLLAALLLAVTPSINPRPKM